MVLCAPRVDLMLHAAIVVLDDGRIPLAELNRRVGHRAAELGLPRPSYSHVRRLALAERARTAETRRRRRARLEAAVDTASAGYASVWRALPALVELLDDRGR
jgi:hypothetical protein